VKVVDITELEAKEQRMQEKEMVEQVSIKFELNEEQDRAYRIAAEHVTHRGSSPLKMYIVRLGGTGKTRVLEAIADLLDRRGESRRLLIAAPTGTAAALLCGSTYHYILGLRDDDDYISGNLLAQIKERLQGVDFIFFDEVSMLSCYDLYRICERLAL
ncbi:hypothetical protein GALMADRAFT_25856, partial [Galerina marginata CBS 339.88]